MKKLLILFSIFIATSCFAQKEQEAAELLGQGLKAYSAKEYTKADSLIQLSLDLNEDAQAYIYSGNNKLMLNDTCAACAAFQKANDMNAGNAADRFSANCIISDSLFFPEDSDENVLKLASYTTLKKERCSDQVEQWFHLPSRMSSNGKDHKLIVTFSIDDPSWPADSLLSLENIHLLPQLNKVYTVTETAPTIKENGSALSAMSILMHTMNSMKYPQKAKDQGIQGTVIVYFVIDENGEKTDFKVIQSVHKLLDEEALRVAQSLPEVGPASVGGKPVKLAYTMPLRFVYN
ncbi:MAG: energy transducer TonB [Flavobacteriales bacterium]|nr:energy transducer TonB [Flavobacteriales bacterium]MDG1765505.1 energy transducer TonB [Flavobacteriales bacterium]